MTGGRSRPRRRWSALERELRAGGGALIAGVDEVGRGPLAGPVVACAVVMPPDAPVIRGVDDSKRLSAAQRVRLAARIRQRALAIGIGAASVREIERFNVYHATVLAMRRALARLPLLPDHVLVDGNPIRSLAVPHRAVVGGDAQCYSIACASIVAKVTRDRLMTALARRYADYAWERNVGYATPDHLAALAARGVTPHHRRSFCRVAQLALALGEGTMAEEAADAAHDIETVVLAESAPGSSDLLLPAAAPPQADPPRAPHEEPPPAP